MNINFNYGDLYALLAALCWSSGVILFELVGKHYSTIQINFLKNIIGIIGFLCVLLFSNQLFLSYTYNEYLILFISSILGVVIGDYFLLASINRLGSSLYAILGTTYTIFVFFFAYIMFQEVISIKVYLGAFLVISGIFIRSIEFPIKISLNVSYIGIIFALLAQCLTAFSILLIRPILESNNIIHIALIRFSIGFLFILSYLLFKEGLGKIKHTLSSGLTNPVMLFGALFGTFFSVIFWMLGFKYTLASRAAVYNQLSTIIISIMAFVFLNEQMTNKKWVSVLLAMSGAILISI